jgi:hypothetical protein
MRTITLHAHYEEARVRATELRQGDAVLLECGRSTAPLGIELAETGVLDSELGRVTRVLGPEDRLADDFSAGSYLLQFLVATASGISATGLVALIKAEIERRADRRGIEIEIDELPAAPDDSSIRLRVRLRMESASLEVDVSSEDSPSPPSPQ